MNEEWTPFQRATLEPVTDELLEKLAADGPDGEDLSKESLREIMEKNHKDLESVWLNNLYQVNVYRVKSNGKAPDMLWLSIKRRDKQSVHDWRHFQRIKNEIVGPENEGIELYPAESRLVDTSNQYHLWVIDSPTYKFPFGYQERLVVEDAHDGKWKQRGYGNG